jgi:hypothetical protein
MKHILTLIISFMVVLSTGGPSYAFQSRCLAVWCNPGMEQFWPSLHPDVMVTAYSWEQFDDFLRQTKAKAAGRPIDLSLDIHGSGEYLYIKYEDYRTGTSIAEPAGWGFVVNHIEKALEGEDVTVVCESCFAGETYNHSIRGNKRGENHPGVPKFPIYGGSYNMYNLNNLIYMQYITGCRVWFCDLRTFDKKEGPPPVEDKNDPVYDRMMALYKILGSLYQPDLPKPISGQE